MGIFPHKNPPIFWGTMTMGKTPVLLSWGFMPGSTMDVSRQPPRCQSSSCQDFWRGLSLQEPRPCRKPKALAWPKRRHGGHDSDHGEVHENRGSLKPWLSMLKWSNDWMIGRYSFTFRKPPYACYKTTTKHKTIHNYPNLRKWMNSAMHKWDLQMGLATAENWKKNNSARPSVSCIVKTRTERQDHANI